MDLDWDPNRATSPQWWDDNYSIPSTASPITPASSLGDSPFTFPTYADGSVPYEDFAFEDPLNLNGISDADVAAFMASPDNAPISFPSQSTSSAAYPYLGQLTPPSTTRSPQSLTRPLLPSTSRQVTQGVKRKAGAEEASQPRRKESRSSPSDASDKPNTRLRTSTRTSSKRSVSSAPLSSSSSTTPTALVAKPHPRTPHHFTEKKYRDRLNDQFGRLLTALESSASREYSDAGAADEDGGMAGRFLSKSAVLEMARHRLRALERENEGLAREVERLAEILRVRHSV